MKPKNVLGFRWSAAVDTKKRNYKKIDADWNVDPEWLCAALNGIGLIIKRDVQTNNIPRELDLCKKYCMDLFNREYYWKRTGLKPSFETMDERKLTVYIINRNRVYAIFEFSYGLEEEPNND